MNELALINGTALNRDEEYKKKVRRLGADPNPNTNTNTNTNEHTIAPYHAINVLPTQ
jgi:hypothetical protein